MPVVREKSGEDHSEEAKSYFVPFFLPHNVRVCVCECVIFVCMLMCVCLCECRCVFLFIGVCLSVFIYEHVC